MTNSSHLTSSELKGIVEELYTTGIVSCRGAFSREWAIQMREDIESAFQEAISREGGAVPRGPHRFYVEIHPEQLRGFVDLVTHPWVQAVCEGVLGPDYEIVEIGFDIPFPGAEMQPWHRDFPSTPEVVKRHPHARVVDRLVPIVQKHTIDGLLQPVY